MDDSKRRLNLQFDMTKAGERQCWGIIEMQGRHKSDFVARAVNFYAENSPEFIPSTADAYQENKMFQSVMKEVLTRLGVPENANNLPQTPTPTEGNKPVISISKDIEEKPPSPPKTIAKANGTPATNKVATQTDGWSSKEAEDQVDAFLDALEDFG